MAVMERKGQRGSSDNMGVTVALLGQVYGLSILEDDIHLSFKSINSSDFSLKFLPH